MPALHPGGPRAGAAGRSVSFSGHETFPFRQTWLKKAVDAVDRDPRAFAAEDALVALGVGRNMVSSMRHWGLATGVLEEAPAASGRRRARRLQPTRLGGALLRDDGWDPYLEDPGTLWLLHWRLARRPERATTWWWVFNCLTGASFTRADLVEGIGTLGRLRGWTRLTRGSLKRDVEVFVRTYAPDGRPDAVAEETLDCPLADLGVIRRSRQPQTYRLVRDRHPSLPAAVFACALAEYLADRPSRQTVTVEELLFADGAPGRVCCLDEAGLLARLDHLESMTGGGVVFDETAGLKQIYVHREPDPAALLAQYYRAADAPAGGADAADEADAAGDDPTREPGGAAEWGA